MKPSVPRRETRFTLGTTAQVAVRDGSGWREYAAFTVNVSENGLLVTLPIAPRMGEPVKVRVPGPDEFWGEAVVRHIIRGKANFLVGLQLAEKHGPWLVKPATHRQGPA